MNVTRLSNFHTHNNKSIWWRFTIKKWHYLLRYFENETRKYFRITEYDIQQYIFFQWNSYILQLYVFVDNLCLYPPTMFHYFVIHFVVVTINVSSLLHLYASHKNLNKIWANTCTHTCTITTMTIKKKKDISCYLTLLIALLPSAKLFYYL